MTEIKKQDDMGNEGADHGVRSIDDLINTIMESVATLQSAVKDLTGLIKTATEAQRGMQESLLGSIKELKADIEEIKKIAVGVGEASKVHADIERSRVGSVGKPQSAGEEATVSSDNLQFPGATAKSVEMTKNAKVEIVKTERPDIEVSKSGSVDEYEEFIKGVVRGTVKPGEFSKVGRVMRA